MDAGNFSGDSSEAGRRNTQLLLAGMGRMAHAAVNLGERDLLFGADKLREWAKQSSVSLISANLVYQDSGEPAFDSSLVKTVETGHGGGRKRKLRVGILGLARMNSGLSVPGPSGRRIVTADPVAAARIQIPELRRKSDFILILATLEPEQAKDLAKQVEGIDVILGGSGPIQVSEEVHPTAASPTVHTRVIYAGNQGKKLGEVRVFLAEKGQPAKLDVQAVNLGKIIPDDPAIMDLVEQNRIAINEINKKDAPLVDSEKLRAMYSGASFVKSESCKACHEEAYKIWEGSNHAHAFKILEDRHQDYNPECVGCHTTGFRHPTGFLNAKSTPDLANVQCESCHGPGSGHPDKVGKEYGPVARDLCITCHTPVNSPDFDPIAYRVKIRHWEEKPAGAGAPTSSR